MEKLVITVTGVESEMKISDYLKRRCGFSSALITKVKFGGVRVGAEVVTMRAFVKNGDVITVNLPEEKNEDILPMDIPLDIVYEDEYMLLVNKPSGMPTHPAKSVKVPTLANAVMHYMGEGFIFRAVNRLDSGTSGLVIIAKDAFASAKLGRAMKNGKIKKKYVAEVSGIPERKEDIINAPIARECDGALRRVVREDGKTAVTEYKVIGITNEKNAICEILLHTGRTHQIRVHFSHIGHPLTNDFLYGYDSGEGYKLCCFEITLPHPKTDTDMTVRVQNYLQNFSI